MIYTLMLNAMIGIWLLWFFRRETRKTKYEGPYLEDVRLVYGIVLFAFFVVATAVLWLA